MALAIIFKPEAIDQRGALGLFYPLKRERAKGVREEVELVDVLLHKGVNFVEPDVWKGISGHNAQYLADISDQGAIQVIAPDAEEIVGATTDYSNVGVARTILNNVNDLEWLRSSLARDQRKVVVDALRERISEIEEEIKNRRRQSSSTLELV